MAGGATAEARRVATAAAAICAPAFLAASCDVNDQRAMAVSFCTDAGRKGVTVRPARVSRTSAGMLCSDPEGQQALFDAIVRKAKAERLDCRQSGTPTYEPPLMCQLPGWNVLVVRPVGEDLSVSVTLEVTYP